MTVYRGVHQRSDVLEQAVSDDVYTTKANQDQWTEGSEWWC